MNNIVTDTIRAMGISLTPLEEPNITEAMRTGYPIRRVREEMVLELSMCPPKRILREYIDTDTGDLIDWLEAAYPEVLAQYAQESRGFVPYLREVLG